MVGGLERADEPNHRQGGYSSVRAVGKGAGAAVPIGQHHGRGGSGRRTSAGVAVGESEGLGC